MPDSVEELAEKLDPEAFAPWAEDYMVYFREMARVTARRQLGIEEPSWSLYD